MYLLYVLVVLYMFVQDSLEDQPQAEGTFPVKIKIYLSIYLSIKHIATVHRDVAISAPPSINYTSVLLLHKKCWVEESIQERFIS